MSEPGRREYKMMLRADAFAGDAGERRRAVRNCWHYFRDRLGAQGIRSAGELDRLRPDKQRDVVFLDTPDRALRRMAAVLYRIRRRRDRPVDWDATLKFRSGDRMLGEHMRFRCVADGSAKVEEDIRSPFGAPSAGFMSLYSRSATCRNAFGDVPKDLGACLQPFERLDGLQLPDRGLAVNPVGGYEMEEHVFEGSQVILTDTVSAECALIVWIDPVDCPGSPVLAEFSFRYDLDSQAGVAAAAQAWRAFCALYADRVRVDPTSLTKTAFIYGAQGE